MKPEIEDSLFEDWVDATCAQLNQRGGVSNITENDVRQLMRVVWQKALDLKLIEAMKAMKEVIRISDRDHEAWNTVKELIKNYEHAK